MLKRAFLQIQLLCMCAVLLTWLALKRYNINMLEFKITDEQYLDLLNDLLFALTRETEQQMPENLTIKQKRWLLDGLLEVRSAGELEDSLLAMQDKLLSFENSKRGVVEIDGLKHEHGVAVFDGILASLNVDVCVLFGNSLIAQIDEQTETEKNILLAAGLQVKETFAEQQQEFHNVLPKTKIYVSNGFNLPCKKIVKILVNEKQNNLPNDFAEFESALNELLSFLKENKFKSVAFDFARLTENDLALAEILKRKIKLFKKSKIKICLKI